MQMQSKWKLKCKIVARLVPIPLKTTRQVAEKLEVFKLNLCYKSERHINVNYKLGERNSIILILFTETATRFVV